MAPTALLGTIAWRQSIFTRAGCFDGVGGEVLLRLEKNNATDRSHESINGNEKRNYDLFAGGMGASPSSFLLASGGCGSVSFKPYIAIIYFLLINPFFK